MGGSGAFIVNFEHISHLFLVFPLLTLNIICWHVFAECIQSLVFKSIQSLCMSRAVSNVAVNRGILQIYREKNFAKTTLMESFWWS